MLVWANVHSGFFLGLVMIAAVLVGECLEWLISRWRCQQETLTFEADLDCPPAFNLEVNNYRWQRKLPRRSMSPHRCRHRRHPSLRRRPSRMSTTGLHG